jgi:hypothetical protein
MIPLLSASVSAPEEADSWTAGPVQDETDSRSIANSKFFMDNRSACGKMDNFGLTISAFPKN